MSACPDCGHEHAGDRLAGICVGCPCERRERRAPGLDFGAALAALKAGKRVARAGWNGKGMFLGLVRSDEWTFTNGRFDNYGLAPFIAMKTADEKLVPWLASQTDLLAEDWEVLS